MGHQTNYKKCQKCGQVIITTIVQYLMLRKEIVTTNCKCKQVKENNSKYNK